jgi:hypothetical protein
MCAAGNNQEFDRATGHAGTLRFLDEEELQEVLDSLGDEISDFYDGAQNSRPYNFKGRPEILRESRPYRHPCNIEASTSVSHSLQPVQKAFSYPVFIPHIRSQFHSR